MTDHVAAEIRQPLAQGCLAGQDLAQLASRSVAVGLAAKCLVLLRSCDDLGVETSELLGELEVVFGERIGPQLVMEIQYAEDLTLVDQRNAERRFDVETLAYDLEAVLIGLAAKVDRSRLFDYASGDALADLEADLGP